MTEPPLLVHARVLLTSREFEAFELAFLGLSRRKIAIVLGVAPSTIRDRLVRARAKLGVMLDEREEAG